MKFFKYVIIFVIVLSSISCFTIDTISLLKNDDKGICKNGFCGSTSHKDLVKAIRSLFYAKHEISMLDNVNNAAVATPLTRDELQTAQVSEPSHRNADDGDVCCSTHIRNENKTTMINIFGENMTIFHYWQAPEPTYQYIPHASCVRTGSCPGECVIEQKTLVLLAYDAEYTLRFDLFNVPGYCSCKNSGK